MGDELGNAIGDELPACVRRRQNHCQSRDRHRARYISPSKRGVLLGVLGGLPPAAAALLTAMCLSGLLSGA